ncbi:dihydrofolate reductase [Nocardia sp. CDC160]|uniref:dihydrofolate reductase n=1 Tax=Nocardia sp. CDC160 TaxID=3112166 RepID=UPI002DBAE042|nr:dihydrofolate reductase [Nocardia sp. CDC160]MEC3915956.1 dihydrofolate reductase [Nocardia sp. CDC160]
MTGTGERIIGLIWAQDRNRTIGVDGGLPWRIPEHFEHFHDVTDGRPIIMGHHTWNSLPEQVRHSPTRRNIVLTHTPDQSDCPVETATTLAEALALTYPRETWIIGGGETLCQAMPFATTLAVTEISAHANGDTSAPHIPVRDFMLAYTIGPRESSNPGLTYEFRSYVHRPSTVR